MDLEKENLENITNMSTIKILNELRKTKGYPKDRGLSVDCSFMTALICLGQLVSSAIVGVLIESYGSSRNGFQSKETVGDDRGLLKSIARIPDKGS